MTHAELLWSADIADARAAHALEEQARALVTTLHGGDKALDAAWAKERKGDGRRTSRAPAAMALRRAVRSLPPSREANRARALLQRADERYWAMVLRHGAFLARECNRLSNRRDKASDQWQDVMQLLRVGWYRAAIRFDPDRGRRFPTMAASWGRQYVALHRDHGPLTRFNPRTELREPAGDVLSFNLTSPDPNAAGLSLSETVPHEQETAEAIESRADVSMQLRILSRYLARLPEPQRRVLELRHLSRRQPSLSEVGQALGITKQAIQQVEDRALATIRAWMAEDGLISVDARVSS